MIERFIEDYADKGYQFAFHLCGNAEDAKELVQEAFVRLIRKWEQFDNKQSLENWFLAILRNLYFDGLKRCERRRSVPLDAQMSEDGCTFADGIDSREETLLSRLERQEASQEVRRALDTLPAEQRAVIMMVDMQGMGYDEAAAVMDSPSGTVRSRLFRARAALKKALLAQAEEVKEA